MTGNQEGRSSHFSVLIVCTANICRSPAAEVLMRAAFGPANGISIESAGLHARVGEPMARETARLLGVPPETVVARQLTAEVTRRADLALTMTRAHRAAVVSAAPGMLRRTFTLREFGDLASVARSDSLLPLGASPSERLAALTAVAPPLRSRRSDRLDDDVEDPYGRDTAIHQRVLDVLRGSVAAVVGSIAP